MQPRLERGVAERVAIADEKARRPLQRMAENDEGDGEETQPVDLRAVSALRDLALEPGGKSRQPAARRRRSIWIRPRTSPQLSALPQGRDYARPGVIGGLSRSHRGRFDEGDQRAHRRPGVDDRHAGAAAHDNSGLRQPPFSRVETRDRNPRRGQARTRRRRAVNRGIGLRRDAFDPCPLGGEGDAAGDRLPRRVKEGGEKREGQLRDSRRPASARRRRARRWDGPGRRGSRSSRGNAV